uniref:CCR4-NOT transcription complex subunit 4 n=1 Tax=Chenopodium quinoa TaxID=63459 RepID=A0A803L3P9_CHEQI
MSDEGEKTCPLCAEEMDLTDQQLKPCRCGYEICVWCWHHIMDMAEKDESEGRCPACRTAYDKDRIVGMAADCERLVQEVNMEKKHKSHKAKVKTSDSRKQLSSVRVIQRNLVYIVGLPLELADEDLLQHKDYFAQYGKVLKVSISRTSAGTIQQFANNTCSVYITYSKEEESIRCIQSVHGFILDARPLRACFGTTKYCHAWLRNVPCTNPDCLYLHEIGSLEDSFTKDEIISAYTRVELSLIREGLEEEESELSDEKQSTTTDLPSGDVEIMMEETADLEMGNCEQYFCSAADGLFGGCCSGAVVVMSVGGPERSEVRFKDAKTSRFGHSRSEFVFGSSGGGDFLGGSEKIDGEIGCGVERFARELKYGGRLGDFEDGFTGGGPREIVGELGGGYFGRAGIFHRDFEGVMAGELERGGKTTASGGLNREGVFVRGGSGASGSGRAVGSQEKTVERSIRLPR